MEPDYYIVANLSIGKMDINKLIDNLAFYQKSVGILYYFRSLERL